MTTLSRRPGSQRGNDDAAPTGQLTLDHPPGRSVTVAPEHSGVVCFAMEQSGVPIVQRVVVRNTGTEPLPITTLKLAVEPGLSDHVVRSVHPLRPGEEHDIGVIDVPLPPGHLRMVLEAERAQLVWQLLCGESVVAGGQSAIEVLAHNEWPGVRAPPGLLATFAMPNNPAIGSLLQSVSQRVQTATGSSAIDGYQAKSPARAYALVQALYDCIQAMGLSYASVQPSFEQVGQKVRLPDVLLGDRVGNCLDLTLFVVAALEQMGLAPLIVLFNGHAIPAVWLLDDRFPEGIVSDTARLRTAIALRYLVAFDSSTMVDTSSPSLEVAQDAADRLLRKDADFEYAVDVRVARRNGFRPLSLREGTEGPASIGIPAHVRGARPPVDVPPPVSHQVRRGLDPIQDRFRLWRDQLLDLSLRNKLLNFRADAKSAIPLDVPDIGLFEDLLASDKRVEVLPAAPRDHRDARDPVLQESRVDPAQRDAELLVDLRRLTIHSALQPDELAKRGVHLERAARVALEDGGANTLYVAIGLLRWYESPEEDSAKLAPLLLVPVQLEYQRTTRRILIRHIHEESLPNHTLVEKLKADFGVDLVGLANIEPDESGLDVPTMLRAVRDAIRHMPRWEVEERACLGLFTFTKFLMWKDLTSNLATLLESPVVRFLASNGAAELPATAPVIEPGTLDERVPLDALPLVLDSDSSQTSAIMSALSKRSFVLQGPPGTGKSQTITNLIAAALHSGKTVLFVSEKMAALEVVHRRLRQVGLGDFCLELHSHKAQKRNIILSFKQALERKRAVTNVPWVERSQELGALREALNVYVDALHRPRATGRSFFKMTSRLLELQDAPRFRLSIPNVVEMAEVRYRELGELAGRLATAALAVEPIGTHPWSVSGLRNWSSAFEESLGDALVEALRQIDVVRPRAAALCDTFAVPLSACSPSRLNRLARLIQGLTRAPMPQACLDADNWRALAVRTERWRGAITKADETRGKLAARWSEKLFEIDLAPLVAIFERWAYAFFLFAWIFLWGARSRMREVARTRLPSNGQIAEDLRRALTLLGEQGTLEAERVALAQSFEGTWGGTDVGSLQPILKLGAEVREQVEKVGGASQIPPAARVLLDPATPEPARQTGRALADSLLDALESCQAAILHAAQALQIPTGSFPLDGPEYFAETERLLEHYLHALPKLRAWCLYASLLDEARKKALAPVADAHLGGLLPAKDIERAVERSILEGWTMAVRDSEPALRDFDGPNRHRLVDRFRDQDRAHIELGCRKVVEALEERLPAMTERTSDKSELGILRREVEKKTRHTPIRKLLQQVPNVLPRLKPCLLMSPLSVAQYLPAAGKRFDLVVFDEASQICTHDAIGAIARGSQVVVVGDSKQLPPTSFFKRSADEETQNENDFDELESVLDEAKAAGLPEQMLTWHYRSRHEALIGFSNDHYYDGRLNVFPAAASRVSDLGVHWHAVRNGVYERNRSRSNPIEAKAAVQFLVKRLEATEPGRRSFGVVTFSQAQQDLVEDLLDQARGMNPKIEPHFSDQLIEPVFVKNLENVQGDERDEILFSIGYGPDETGRVSMNFGPLNRKGGERRLNVAVTRARQVLRVFSTLAPEQIDLRRTDTLGPRHLKAFLTYVAESGAHDDARVAVSVSASAFEKEVAAHLRGCGHQVAGGVGRGAYKLELAVAHPERPGVYALAIESDGDAYASAATARDRDRLRHEVLAGSKGLGWQLHRIWSSDWWFDKAREIRRLEEAIAAAVAREPPSDWTYEPLPEDVEEVLPSDENAVREPETQEGSPVSGAARQGPSPLTPYRRARLPRYATDPEALFADASGRLIRVAIAEVVGIEAPLHVDEMCRRVGAAFGVSRLSQRMKARILQFADAHSDADVQGEFVWKSGVRQFEGMRGPSEDGDVRQADHLPPEEVANVVQWVLSENLSLPQDELLREVARSFGLQRAGSAVVERLLQGVRNLERRGGCVIDGSRITCCVPESAAQPGLHDSARSEPVGVSISAVAFDDYEIVQELGGGGMAECFKARERATGDAVFLKRVREGSAEAAALERELEIYGRLQYVDCRHLLTVLDVRRRDGFVTLVTEFADGGDLKRFVESEAKPGLSPRGALGIALEIAMGLYALHEQSIVHRDLKPENVLRADSTWKLADFGIAKNRANAAPGRTFQQAGTYGYAAPEQFDGIEAHPSADIYSFGKIVTFLLTGTTDPDKIRLEYDEWRKLARRCVQYSPEARPTIDDIVEALQRMAGETV